MKKASSFEGVLINSGSVMYIKREEDYIKLH